MMYNLYTKIYVIYKSKQTWIDLVETKYSDCTKPTQNTTRTFADCYHLHIFMNTVLILSKQSHNTKDISNERKSPVGYQLHIVVD